MRWNLRRRGRRGSAGSRVGRCRDESRAVEGDRAVEQAGWGGWCEFGQFSMGTHLTRAVGRPTRTLPRFPTFEVSSRYEANSRVYARVIEMWPSG